MLLITLPISDQLYHPSPQVCFGCQNTGRIDQGRPYTLFFVADAAGNPNEELTALYKQRSNTAELVELCSIRVDPDQKPAAITGCDEETKAKVDRWVALDNLALKCPTAVKKQTEKDPRAIELAEAEAKKREENRDSLVDMDPDTKEFESIAKYILSEFNGTPIATHVRKTTKGDLYIINSKCTWCANKGDSHGHSNVYYMLSPKGCVQRCFCMKMQKGGLCCKYTSPLHNVPQNMLSTLFPEALLNTRRKEEARLKMGEDILGRPTPYLPPPTTQPYGVPQGVINLPTLPPGTTDRLRRRGITKKTEYESAPKANLDDIINLIHKAKYDMFRMK